MASLDSPFDPVQPSAAPVEISFDKFSAFVESYAARLSLGGMFLESTEPRPVGSTVAFEILLEDGYRLIRGSGRVEWVRPHSPGPERPAGMGVRFEALDESSRDLILKILEEHVKVGGQPFDVDEVPADAVAVPGAPAAADAAAPDAPGLAAGATPEETVEFGAPWGPEPPEPPAEVLEDSPAGPDAEGEGGDGALLAEESPETRPHGLVDPFDRDVFSSAEKALEEIETASGPEPADDPDLVVASAAGASGPEPVPGAADDLPGAAAPDVGPARPPPPAMTAREPADTESEPGRLSRRRLALAALLLLLLAGGVWVVRGPLAGAFAPAAAGPPVGSAAAAANAPPVTPPAPRTLRDGEQTDAEAKVVPAEGAAGDPPEADPVAEVVAGPPEPTEPPPASPAPASTTELAPAASEPPAAPVDMPPARRLADLSWESRSDGTLVILSLDGPLDESRARYDRLTWTDKREQLSLLGLAGPYRAAAVPVDTPEILRIRTGYHAGSGGGELRLVFDLAAGGAGMSELRVRGDRVEILYPARP